MSNPAADAEMERARARLREFRPQRKWWRGIARRSAVAMPLRAGRDGLEVLMIERAHREGDRWSGHMAFPGGMLHESDKDSLHGALRETREEIGIDLEQQGTLLARLSDIGTVPHVGYRRPMIITPYVFAVQGEIEPRLNHEVAGVVWVPLHFLADHRNRGLFDYERKQRMLHLPFYTYADKRIWGLSLHMLDELLPVIGATVR